MARAAIPGGLSARRAWRPARLLERRVESASATTLVLDVTDWPGHLPGQHVDVRLTADDGYTATRSYSLAAPADGDRVEVTVQRVPDGEVSPFLCDDLQVGDSVELRGPVGGWFVWRPDQPEPVLLVAGGSGVVPLMAMLRARPADGPPFRLVYSARQPDDVIYRDELAALAATDGVDVRHVFTRRGAPDGADGDGGDGASAGRPPGRLRAADLDGAGWGPADAPTCYVCGPTGFVEAAATILASAGHDAARIRTERFGPTGS
ncbi:MAG TPA: ferredoxin reductase [Humibacillus xanthopallidus]|nr:ferredoxin reductase [Humibacillus xanthopallidus]